jgi:UDPglucose 6-dehydrogenase
MKVAVVGLWHLGSVTAACLAGAGHSVTGLDPDETVIENLKKGRAPLFEPGLDELLASGLTSDALTFTTEPAEALSGAEIVWITYDTPVDDDDVADIDYVILQVRKLFPAIERGALVLMSSQLPVGSTRRLQTAYEDVRKDSGVSFACSPENLRLGSAIEVFTKPDRVVVGVSRDEDRARIAKLLEPITSKIEWMSVESAEMTKHALNSFLAVSVAFINEFASLCERVGASGAEVSRGLKTDVRIGPRAYLKPGAAFSGGTLARDLGFVSELGNEHDLPMDLVAGARRSNDAHKEWTRRKLETLRKHGKVKCAGVWGLTYKAGTSALRRSGPVELCEWLLDRGVEVKIHDPTLSELPDNLAKKAVLSGSPLEAVQGASVLLVTTEWPEYRRVLAPEVIERMDAPTVIDPSGFLRATLGADPRIQYSVVGEPT